jgi:thermitase
MTLRPALVAAWASALVFAVPASAGSPAASGRILVGFEKGVSKQRQQEILSVAGGRIGRRFAAIRGGRLAVVRPRSGRATDAVRNRLRHTDGVAYAEPDFFQFTSQEKTPDDPLYALDYALVDSPDDHDIDAPAAWAARTGCAKVAILDTGIDTDHPDLAPNV